jgi:sirohydrochlorin cobaltochelatase
MFTPGGSNSELDLTAEIEEIRRNYPAMELEYAWPYDVDCIVDFLVAHLDQDR